MSKKRSLIRDMGSGLYRIGVLDPDAVSASARIGNIEILTA
jgi:hypothetical protein